MQEKPLFFSSMMQLPLINFSFVDKKLCSSTISTVGMHHFSSSFTPDGPNAQSIPALLWDTAGHERFRSITQSFYKNASAVILVYNVCERKTFDSVQYWLQSIRQHANEDVLLTFVGNKVDDEDNRVV